MPCGHSSDDDTEKKGKKTHQESDELRSMLKYANSNRFGLLLEDAGKSRDKTNSLLFLGVYFPVSSWLLSVPRILSFIHSSRKKCFEVGVLGTESQTERKHSVYSYVKAFSYTILNYCLVNIQMAQLGEHYLYPRLGKFEVIFVFWH